MIKISTKTRYALRAMLEMACRTDKQVFSLEELSRHQNISRKYLELIFGTLRKAGFVLSKTGKNGGFYLPRDLKRLSILNILEALEGKVDIVNCVTAPQSCKRYNICAATMIWKELNQAIKATLASKNLQDLASHKDIREKCAFFYSRTTKT